MVTTLLESYSIALEGVSDLNHRVLKENRELRADNERLNAECWCGCNDDLKAEYNDMKAEINTLIKSNNKRVEMIKELKNQLATSIKDEDIIQAQGEEIKRLKADIRHDAKVCDDYDDDLIEECRNLQAENDKLRGELKTIYGTTTNQGDLIDR